MAKAAKKVQKKSNEPGAREQRDALKIKVLDSKGIQELIEARKNSHASKVRSLYAKCKTVGEYKKAGGDLGYLNSDFKKRKLISVG